MNIVSHCCGAPIEQGARTEYPLGGSVWGISIPMEVCGECGREADPVHQCENCGFELNGDNPEIWDLGCYNCVEEVFEDVESREDNSLRADEVRSLETV